MAYFVRIVTFTLFFLEKNNSKYDQFKKLSTNSYWVNLKYELYKIKC